MTPHNSYFTLPPRISHISSNKFQLLIDNIPALPSQALVPTHPFFFLLVFFFIIFYLCFAAREAITWSSSSTKRPRSFANFQVSEASSIRSILESSWEDKVHPLCFRHRFILLGCGKLITITHWSQPWLMQNPVDIKIQKPQAHTLIEIRFRIKTFPTKPLRNLFLKT